MYIINIEDWDKEKVFRCNKLLAEWLIYQQYIPLMGRDKQGGYYFSKTKKLSEALNNAPPQLMIDVDKPTIEGGEIENK